MKATKTSEAAAIATSADDGWVLVEFETPLDSQVGSSEDAFKPKDVKGVVEGLDRQVGSSREDAFMPKDLKGVVTIEGLDSQVGSSSKKKHVDRGYIEFEANGCPHPLYRCDSLGSNGKKWRYSCRRCGTFWSGPAGTPVVPVGPGQKVPQRRR